MSSPCLIPGPLKPKPKLILTQFQGLTLSTPGLVKNQNIFCEGKFRKGGKTNVALAAMKAIKEDNVDKEGKEGKGGIK